MPEDDIVEKYAAGRPRETEEAFQRMYQEVIEDLVATIREQWVHGCTKRVEGKDGKLSKVIRINEPRADSTKSLGQKEIARWPHDGCGIDLGQLGDVTPRTKLPSAASARGLGLLSPAAKMNVS
jgi:hypothetical protein